MKKQFWTVAGTLAAAGVALAAVMYLKRPGSTSALGNWIPGQRPPPPRPLPSSAQVPNPAPPGGFSTPEQTRTAGDILAWGAWARPALDTLRAVFTSPNEPSAVIPAGQLGI